MSIPDKTIYKTTNWHDYNRALRQRGSLTVSFDPAMVWEAAPSGKPNPATSTYFRFGLRAVVCVFPSDVHWRRIADD